MGHDPADEFAILRRRMDALEEDAESRRHDGLDRMSATLVGRVFDGGAMPTTVPGMFLVHPVDLDGAEVVGEATEITADTDDEAVVMVLGPEVPDVGDVLRAMLIGGYWVSQRGGVEEEETTPTAASCLCPSLPNTIHVTVDNVIPGLYMDHTLELMPVMAEYTLGTKTLGATKYWYSPVEYTDGTADSFNVFRYCLICHDAGPDLRFFAIARDFKSVGSGKENPVAFFTESGHPIALHGELVQCVPLEGVHTVTESFYATPAPGQVAKSFAQITGFAEPLVPTVTVSMTA